MKKRGGARELRVAYSAGPPQIVYAGRAWTRGVAQPVTREQWAAMRARGDFDGFGFAEVSNQGKD